MSPFEAHILIQQVTNNPSTSAGSSFPNIRSRTTSFTTSTETILHEALKSHTLNPNVRFKNESLLSTIIKKGCSNLLQLFLEHGADPNLKSYENGRYEPALITAVRYKSLRCVQILLQFGANLSKTNFYGTDAIFQAVHENAFEILDCLLCHDHNEQSQQRQQQKTKKKKRDVPTTAAISSSSSSSSSSSLLPPVLPLSLPPSLPPHHHQSIIIQKTTAATMKGKDSKEGEGGNKATSLTAGGIEGMKMEVVKTGREKPSNNNKSSKGHHHHHEKDDYDDNVDDYHHQLCPFYYALNSALSYPSKRVSLALLFQSYYKCKCVKEIASCYVNSKRRNGFSQTNSSIEEEEENDDDDDQVKECLRAVQLSPPNFSPFSWNRGRFPGENKSVPLSSSVHDGDGVRQRHYYYSTVDHHQHDPDTVVVRHADNENDISFELRKTAGEGRRRGGEGNEHQSINLFPYKVYKIQGKCHVIKENESSSSLPPPPSPAAVAQTRAQKERPSSSYVVLVGPLKLSCITREVIRDQIMRSTQTTCTTSTATCTNASAQSGSPTTITMTVAPHHPHPQLPLLQSRSDGVTAGALDYLSEETGRRWKTRRNFRKSLETLTMPSSLMDYILYRNIQWNYSRAASSSSSDIPSFPERKGEMGEDEDENNELRNSTTSNIDNIQLIKRDLEFNRNYFAIYIY